MVLATFGEMLCHSALPCPETAATLNNMAGVYFMQGDYEKALFHYGKAQEVYVAVFGDMHLQLSFRDVA